MFQSSKRWRGRFYTGPLASMERTFLRWTTDEHLCMLHTKYPMDAFLVAK